MNLVSYDFWIIFFYLSLVSFVTFLLLLIFLKLRKNEYLHTYVEDDVFKTYSESGVKNTIYGVNGSVKNFIKRYALRKSNYDTSFIANYQGRYEQISYFVVCYDKKLNVCGVVQVSERNNNETGKIIGLPRKTNVVNVVIKRVDETNYATSIIRPLSVGKIRLFSLFYTICFFNLAYIIRHIICLIIGSDYLREFYTSFWNFYAFLGMIVMAIIIYFISVCSMRRKSSKNRSGGISYEFN